MGKLINGQWVTDEQLQAAEALAYKKADGKFQRASAGFRHWVTADGRPGPNGTGGFRAEPHRYHLYAALNCPWAHRTLIYRRVKQLDDIISVSLAAPTRTDQGWVFSASDERFTDNYSGLSCLHQAYSRAAPDYTGRVTVPVLWDNKNQNDRQ